MYLPLSSLGIYVKGIYPGIYLFTNRVITHFGSNFLKIFWDFADLRVGRNTPGIYPGIYHSRYLPGIYLKKFDWKLKLENTQGIYLWVYTSRFLL